MYNEKRGAAMSLSASPEEPIGRNRPFRQASVLLRPPSFGVDRGPATPNQLAALDLHPDVRDLWVVARGVRRTPARGTQLSDVRQENWPSATTPFANHSNLEPIITIGLALAVG